jgi:hypothetical protein
VAQSAPNAASVTEPGRTLARPLDIVLGGRTRRPEERTIVLLLDPSQGLQQAGFVAALGKAIADNRATLAKTRLGLCLTGEHGGTVVAPTSQFDQVVRAAKAALRTPTGEFRNLYAGAREAVSAFKGSKGERTLLLVALENADVEDDVAQTASLLKKADVTLVALTSEATLADSYWAGRPNQRRPRKTELTGPDGAVVDLPWGWLFQSVPANETTPAGYAMWGLNHLAAATEGRVFLHASSQQTRHQCGGVRTTCLFCSGDHEHPDDSWNMALVAQLSPSVSSRDDTMKELGRDPVFRAMIDTWRAAARAGLVRSEPPIKISTTSASPDRARNGRDLGLLARAGFKRNAKKARQAAKKAQQLRDALADRLATLGKDAGSMRSRAAASYTVVMLQVTRVNLLTYAAWCEQDAPALFDGDLEPQPPEVPRVDPDRRPVGIGFSNFALCHGVEPFYGVELPGAPELRPELERLDAMFRGYQLRYGKSQFGYALRRNGIAQFWPTFPGIAGNVKRRRPKSNNDQKGPITERRPTRSGGGSAGGAGGPTTGGGR